MNPAGIFSGFYVSLIEEDVGERGNGLPKSPRGRNTLFFQEERMNKKELVESIAAAADISKAAAEKALNGTLAAIAETLKKGDKITLVGFGTFSVSKREARKGRNPQSGKTINIPAKKVAKFKAGSKLSEAIN